MEQFYLCNSAALESGLSKSAFKVYSFLSMAANSKTRDSFYARAKIAAKCQLSKSTVIRAVRELCRKGLLEIRRRFQENGRQTSNLYILLDSQQINISEEKKQTGGKKDAKVNRNYPQKKDAQGKLQLFKCSPAAHQANLPANTLKVYTYLFLRASGTSEAFPSKREIAKGCQISTSTVFRAIKRLKNAGFLRIISQTRRGLFGNNGTTANRYILKCPDPIESYTSSSNRSKKCELPAVNSAYVCRILIALFSGIKHHKILPFFALTPSPVSWMTPLRTIPKTKTKQRKEYNYSILPKRKILLLYSKWIK